MSKSDHDKKEGVSINQIESFGRNYRLEIFFSALFFVSSICSFLFFSPSWSIYAIGIGGIVGAIFNKQVSKLILSVFNFCMSQQKMTKIVIAACSMVIAVFLAPIFFLSYGLVAGKNFIRCARESCKIHGRENDHKDLH